MSEESKLEVHCASYGKKRGWITFKLLSTLYVGLPDRVFIKNGTLIFVEFKSKKGALSSKQLHTHQRLIKQGMTVLLIDDKRVFHKEIDSYGH